MAERKAVTIYVGDAASLVRASAEARAAIKSVQDQANKKSGLDALPSLGGKITTSLLAVAPAVEGLAGALGGLASSAAAAAGGAGAVGAGGLGALAVGLGSIAAVVKPAMDNFKKVTTALDAYNLTMAKSGTTAKQATAAHSKLNAVVSQNGGKDVLAAAKSWDALGTSFQKLTGPARASLFKLFNDGLGTMKALLPTVAGIANKSMGALTDALQKPLKMLQSSEFKGILRSLGDTFAQSIGPAIDAVSNVFLGFMRIAQAAGPYVTEFAKSVDAASKKFLEATGNSAKLNGTIAFLVSNTKSWGNLIEAVGKLIFDVFKQGVSSGQGMVDNLTAVVKKWDAWATSVGGSQKISQFFQDSAKFVKELGSALGPVVKAISVMSTGALPVYISLMSKLKGVMGPLTYAFVAYKGAVAAATAATKAAGAISTIKNLIGGGAGAAGGAAATTAAGATSVETAVGGGAGAAAASGASIGFGTLAVGAAAAFIGIQQLSKAINGDGGVNAGLKRLQTEMQQAISAGNASKLQQLAGTAEQMGSKLSDLGVKGAGAYKTLGAEAKNAATQMTASAAKTAHEMTTSFGQITNKMKEVGPIFKTMQGDAGLSLQKILAQAKSSASAIASTLGDKSNAARVALAQNFSIAAQDVRASMQAGVVNTRQGIKAIAQLVSQALKALGGKPLAVSNFLANIGPGVVTAQQLVAGGALSQGGVNSPHAGGGFIGSPGEKGRDNVPIVVGRGEAVLNHSQQRVVNAALDAVGIGGLPSLFSKVTTPHYMAGGGLVGARPTASYGQLEGLWDGAGGPKSLAPLMAAIALAESGGRDVMQQGQPWATTGWGYWQITPGGPQYFDPMTNAREAVSKYRSQGLGAWTTYTSGAYKQFLHGGVPAVGGLAGASIKAPSVSGSGVMSAIVRSAVGKVTSAANSFLGRQAPTGVSGAFSGAGGASSGPGGLAVFEGVTMAKWIANELSWATKHGWHGQPTSGYRPGFDPHAPGGSEHALINYPGGAVDFGGMTGDPAAYATKLALVELAARLNYPGPRLKMPIGFRDDGHLSGDGHAKGGFVGSFKNGGVAPRDGFAYVHKGETMIPAFAKGGIAKGQGINSILTSAASFLYPLDEALAKLATEIAGLQNSTAPNHNKDIAALTAELVKIRREKINPPQAHNAAAITALQGDLAANRQDALNAPGGKKGAADRKKLAEDRLAIEQKIKDLRAQDSKSVSTRRKDLANQTLTIEEKIKKLRADDSASRKSLADTIRGLTLQSKNLTQLKDYKDAITSLRVQMQGLAQQAAQVFGQGLTDKINATHDAAIAAIQSGPAATQLAAMQSQDTATANQQQLDQLNQGITDAQYLVDHSAGQTHVDALAQLKQAQDALTAFQRQQDEQRLQDQINTATTAADTTQQTALAGVSQQTTDYQNALTDQLNALTDNLNSRKLTYAQWAKDVNAILAPYGLSAATDPTTEGTVAAGPGPAAKKPKKTKRLAGWSGGSHPSWGGARASGGPVSPGMVYRVGEQGPEDVVFGARGTVMTAAQTRSGGGMGGIHIYGDLRVSGSRAARAMVDRLAYRAAIGTA